MQNVKTIPIFQIDTERCPGCRHTFTTCTNVTGTKRPEVGDYTVCGGCTAVLQYGAGMKLRMVEWNDIPKQLRYTVGRVRLAADCVRAYSSSAGHVN